MNEFESILISIKVNPIFENPLLIPALEEYMNYFDILFKEDMSVQVMIDMLLGDSMKKKVRDYSDKEMLRTCMPNMLALIESMK